MLLLNKSPPPPPLISLLFNVTHAHHLFTSELSLRCVWTVLFFGFLFFFFSSSSSSSHWLSLLWWNRCFIADWNSHYCHKPICGIAFYANLQSICINKVLINTFSALPLCALWFLSVLNCALAGRKHKSVVMAGCICLCSGKIAKE